MKSITIVDTDKLNICPISTADIDLAGLDQAKRLKTQNNYLSYAVVILSITVLGFWYYASLKNAPSSQWQHLSEPDDNL